MYVNVVKFIASCLDSAVSLVSLGQVLSQRLALCKNDNKLLLVLLGWKGSCQVYPVQDAGSVSGQH